MTGKAFLLDTSRMTDELYRQLISSVPKARREYTESFARQEDRVQHLCIYILALYALAAAGVSDTCLGFDARGKPYVLGKPNIHISLSHSANYCACAVSAEPVGIDIQQHRLVDAPIPKHFFTQSEREYLSSVPCQEYEKAFFTLWSRKECYQKVFAPDDIRAISVIACPENYIYYDFPLPGFSLAIMGTTAHCPSQYSEVSLGKVLSIFESENNH